MRYFRHLLPVSLLFIIIALEGATAQDCSSLFSEIGRVAPVRPTLVDKSTSERLTKQRVCIRSFPWVDFKFDLDSAWNRALELTLAREPEGRSLARFTYFKDQDYKARIDRKVTEVVKVELNEAYTKHIGNRPPMEMTKVRRRVVELLGSDAEARNDTESDFLKALRNGLEKNQVRRFADLLLIRSLVDAARSNEVLADRYYDQIARTVELLKLDRPRHVTTFNQIEEATYYSEQQLTNALWGTYYAAQGRILSRSTPEYFRVVADYCKSRAAILSNPVNLLDPDTVLPSYHDIARLHRTTSWEQMDVLSVHENVAGLIKNERESIIFLQDSERIRAIKASQDSPSKVMSRNEADVAFRKHAVSEINSRSTESMRLLFCNRSPDGRVLLRLPNMEALEIAAADYARLQEGSLPDAHKLFDYLARNQEVPITLYANALMRREGAALDFQRELSFLLQRALPQRAIFTDPLQWDTEKRASLLIDALREPSLSLHAVVADSSFDKESKPQDFKIVQNIRGLLESAGVRVTNVDGARGDERSVLVITGHSDERLAAFVRNLGERGLLHNRFVIFNSCETALSHRLVSEINTRFGAISTFQLQGTVTPAAIQQYLLKFLEQVRNEGASDFGRSLMDAIRGSNLIGTWSLSKRNCGTTRSYIA